MVGLRGAKVVAGQVGHVDRLGGRPLHAGEFLAGWGTLQEAVAAGVRLWAAFSLGYRVQIAGVVRMWVC